jgi:2-amino-4-hydroxy-6-hydroxymethyldihydropteridine diphosphokinase
MIRSYIALGSNLQNPQQQVLTAMSKLAALPNSQLMARSRLYGSKAVGPGTQNDYVNAAIALDTSLSAEALLDAMQAIEAQHHRQRIEQWGPRTLDLDLLLYGEHKINTERLCVPHLHMYQRDFVLRPLADIAPLELLSPDQAAIDFDLNSDTDTLWVLDCHEQPQAQQ